MNRRDFLKRLTGGLVASAALVVAGPALPEAVKPTTITVSDTVSEIFGVDFQWTDIESALALESKEAIAFYVNPAVYQIAKEWDASSAMWAHRQPLTYEASFWAPANG